MTSSARSRTAPGPHACLPARARGAAAMAAALAILAGDGLAQVAGSEAAAGKVLVAAIGAEGTGTADRPGARALDGGIDLRPLLAQNTTAADAQARDDALLVTFPLATPSHVEDDVARQHGVEIIERWDSAKQRVIQVRVPPGRSAPAVLAALRSDARVQSAQATRIYRPAAAHAAAEPEAEAAGTARVAPGGQPKAAASTQRKALGAKTPKAALPVVSVSAPAALQWLTADEPFVGADGRLR